MRVATCWRRRRGVIDWFLYTRDAHHQETQHPGCWCRRRRTTWWIPVWLTALNLHTHAPLTIRTYALFACFPSEFTAFYWRSMSLGKYASNGPARTEISTNSICITKSSAVAERPRDASCLSVVSFSSTIPRAKSFTISYFGFRFTNA